jgi:hypothetical protein
MAELPSYLQYLVALPRDDPLEWYPFDYQRQAAIFRIGNLSLPPKEFQPYTFNPYRHDLEGTGIPVQEIGNHAAVWPEHGYPIVTPKTHAWVEANQEGLEEVVEVMHEVYASFYEDASEIVRGDGIGHMGFAAWPREGGGIGLQVLGDCACSGPNLYGALQGIEHGYGEYDLHNADTQAQQVSLYAGLGHIAHLASRG